MTLFQLGYVAMSVHLKNSSPSQTMTFKRFSQFENREAAIRKLELIAKSNLENCLRLLKHNKAYDITFFRLSSRLVPLATHEELSNWDYITPIKDELKAIGEFATKHDMRVGFHPDHFVILNSPKKELLQSAIKNLKYHYNLLTAMGIDPTHRCVLHLGGKYENKMKSLERFIENWAYIPPHLQNMIMLENDDKIYTTDDLLYVCEKLNIPFVFDLHHHKANHEDFNWEKDWNRIVDTWSHSPLPVKMHISSPKSEKQFRHHADYINADMFRGFVEAANGSTEKIDCMIEAKKKDEALIQLMNALERHPQIEKNNAASFYFKT
ncbi:UV DNA damage endonuclease [Salirhabdus euzebyi]|uniref:UV DNA damage endonuclease n=1 Tax=Salirhabdus euzebyi TaxID=394506 RepID=A0A841PXT1_9BACI|nr:UV DNA damage repair endonuclease UvsE [Salirhabdus euzebyi]MBB6452316.1 UV DNA damage endonuclease [Salirhabdus euzebyi]